MSRAIKLIEMLISKPFDQPSHTSCNRTRTTPSLTLKRKWKKNPIAFTNCMTPVNTIFSSYQTQFHESQSFSWTTISCSNISDGDLQSLYSFTKSHLGSKSFKLFNKINQLELQSCDVYCPMMFREVYWNSLWKYKLKLFDPSEVVPIHLPH